VRAAAADGSTGGAGIDVGTREFDHQLQAAGESGVEVAAQIGGEDDRAAVRLDAAQQVADFHVGVTVARFLDLAALREQRVGFVELQHHRLVVRGIEQTVEILFGLADVLGHQTAKVDAEQRPVHRAGDDARSEGLAGTRGASEKRDRSAAAGRAPVAFDGGAVFDPQHELAQHAQPVGGQHQIIPAGAAEHCFGAGGRRRLPASAGDTGDQPVLWLQWLPGFVARNGDQPRPAQCARGRQRGAQVLALVRLEGKKFMQQRTARPGFLMSRLQVLVGPAKARLELGRSDGGKDVVLDRRQSLAEQLFPDTFR
jgi:hypothetical protein